MRFQRKNEFLRPKLIPTASRISHKLSPCQPVFSCVLTIITDLQFFFKGFSQKEII